MAAHRWWRLWITAAYGGANAGFAEIELRDSAGGTDRTGAGTASASGAYGGWPASNAVDNNTGTGWTTYTTGSAPWWWAYDFGAGNAFDIVELYITPRQDGWHSEGPSAFDWQYSDDGSAWTTVRSGTANWSGAAAQTFSVAPAAVTGLRVTQEAAEAVVSPSPNVRATQDAAEVVLGAALTPANALVTQEAIEVVLIPAARVTQEVAETVVAGTPAVRATQEAAEVVLGAAALPDVLVTQEVAEAVVAPDSARVRSTQEALEIVLPAIPPEEPNGWTVRAGPVVRWGKHGLGGDDNDGIIVQDPNHPRGKFRVDCTPRITWDSRVADTTNRFFVECRPKVAYVTGPGTASTECISGDGVVPPPSEPPPESLEQNYVF